MIASLKNLPSQVIDPIAPRYNALESQGTVPVLVKSVKTEKLEAPKHPKNEEVGKKFIWKHNRILVDYIDAEALKENENATFINWGNLLIKKINKLVFQKFLYLFLLGL